MIRRFLKDNKLKGILSLEKENLPIIILFNGKEYEVRYTYKNNLYMKGYHPAENADTTLNNDMEKVIDII